MLCLEHEPLGSKFGDCRRSRVVCRSEVRCVGKVRLAASVVMYVCVSDAALSEVSSVYVVDWFRVGFWRDVGELCASLMLCADTVTSGVGPLGIVSVAYSVWWVLLGSVAVSADLVFGMGSGCVHIEFIGCSSSNALVGWTSSDFVVLLDPVERRVWECGIDADVTVVVPVLCCDHGCHAVVCGVEVPVVICVDAVWTYVRVTDAVLDGDDHWTVSDDGCVTCVW